MNNQKLFIGFGILLVVLLLGGGLFIMSSGKKSSQSPTPSAEQFMIEKLSPEDIGLELIPKTLPNDGKQIKVIVSKVADIKHLAYEITYEADIPKSELPPGETEGRVERGVGNDDVSINSSDKKYESKFLDFGSESKGVVRYDTGVTEAKIVMKVTKRDGKVYQVEDSVKF